MSECQFFKQNGYCQSDDNCLYLHRREVRPPCEAYEAGFCKKGPQCENRHVRRQACEFYMCGFCPDGRGCKKVHLKVPALGKGDADEKERDKERDREKERRERVEELERREEENRREFGRRDRRSGRSGKWKNRRDR